MNRSAVPMPTYTHARERHTHRHTQCRLTLRSTVFNRCIRLMEEGNGISISKALILESTCSLNQYQRTKACVFCPLARSSSVFVTKNNIFGVKGRPGSWREERQAN